ncbi:hypothetical protein QE152_g35118 [Popillia japonica]|uniref:Uncharacterized protein n=1 Tax=Popillia japonica TaxID=7064 RepID=A0AAW1IRM0_POPJA
MGKLYGTTLVGKDERNGRINPALEADDDIPSSEVEKLRSSIGSGSTGGGSGGALVGGIGVRNVTHPNDIQTTL